MGAMASPRLRDLRDRRVSPRAFETMAAASVWILAITIVSGAAVRLTGSGLGCPDWPHCTAHDVAAPLQVHAWVEFANRLINAAVSIAAIGMLVAARLRAPRRRDLTLLSAGLLVGLLAEIGLGALVVKDKLAPSLVAAHFLLGMLFLADAVILHQRAALPDEDVGRSRVPLVGRASMLLSRLLLAATAVVVTLGAVVTSTGPHGGSPDVRRFGFSLHAVAQLHGTSVEVFFLITVVAMWSLARTEAPTPVIRRAQVLLLALVAQAAIGYLQYFNGDPAGAVALHVAGASIVVIAVLRYYMGLTTPAALPVRPVVPALPAAAPAPELTS
jgi:cytochrome c oxidase assembly protein subunit 15